MLVIYIDELGSEEKQTYTFTIYNAYKFKEIWDVNVKNLKYYIKRDEMQGVTFEKHPTINGALRLIYPTFTTLQESLKTLRAVSEGRLSITPDDGDTFIKVIQLPFREIDKIKEQKSIDEGVALKESMFLDYQNSDKKFRFEYADLIDFNKGSHIHVNESQSTSTTLRVQMYIPTTYQEKIEKIGFDPKQVWFYFAFDGYLYGMHTVYIGKTGDVFEWDITDLEPDSAYVGLSLSSKHNPLIRPSKAFYGITKDEDGATNNLDGAQLAKPNINMQQFKMWDEKVAIEAIGEKLTKLQYDIIVKKHYEYKHHDTFLFINNAEQHYSEFPWLKTGK